jgi:transposase
MEACYSSHYWARLFTEMGHDVKLIPAQHVKPFVRGNKNDHKDALAIAEAAQRPNIYLFPSRQLISRGISKITAITHVYQGRKLEPGYA